MWETGLFIYFGEKAKRKGGAGRLSIPEDVEARESQEEIPEAA